jgi:hypothetical protein
VARASRRRDRVHDETAEVGRLMPLIGWPCPAWVNDCLSGLPTLDRSALGTN